MSCVSQFGLLDHLVANPPQRSSPALWDHSISASSGLMHLEDGGTEQAIIIYVSAAGHLLLVQMKEAVLGCWRVPREERTSMDSSLSPQG